VSSPRVGCSILMTSAPRSPRICVQYGYFCIVSRIFLVVFVLFRGVIQESVVRNEYLTSYLLVSYDLRGSSILSSMDSYPFSFSSRSMSSSPRRISSTRPFNSYHLTPTSYSPLPKSHCPRSNSLRTEKREKEKEGK
jgi:hypothetical protein